MDPRLAHRGAGGRVKVYLNDFSNAPLRVRIALALKQIAAEEIHIDLEREDRAEASPELGGINPQHMLPVLVDGKLVIHQSLAIIEYLEEKKPHPALLPSDAPGKARVRSLALMIACDGQPLLNLRVRRYLAQALSRQGTDRWFRHWMDLSLSEYEAALARDGATGRFSHGDAPTLADVCLVPQILMAQRFDIPVGSFRRSMRIFDACMALPEFTSATEKAGSVPI
jgi:maleylpyruvate isomerase